ncbi:adenylate cyclase (plasmid) [Sinorhizobium americanum CCGM7]|nr:adenylate cyclase [Sinorhizobium americanum CCGM7]
MWRGLLQTAKDYDWAVAVLQSAAEANPNNLMVVVRPGLAHLRAHDPRQLRRGGCRLRLAA